MVKMTTKNNFDISMTFLGHFHHIYNSNFLFCCALIYLPSSMEPYRRFRLIFHSNVQLSSETWLQCDDGQLRDGLSDFRICCVFCNGRFFLHRLYGA